MARESSKDQKVLGQLGSLKPGSLLLPLRMQILNTSDRMQCPQLWLGHGAQVVPTELGKLAQACSRQLGLPRDTVRNCICLHSNSLPRPGPPVDASSAWCPWHTSLFLQPLAPPRASVRLENLGRLLRGE